MIILPIILLLFGLIINSNDAFNQVPIAFNIDSGVDTNSNLIFKQNFNQSTINYCNFDPVLLNDKRKTILNNRNEENNEFKVNITMPYEYFNETSQINGIFLYSHLRIFNKIYIFVSK